MAWTTSTLATTAGGQGATPSSGFVMPLDNGDIWWFLIRTPNPTRDITFGDYETGMAVMKLGADHIERVSASDQGLSQFYADPSQYLDGPVEENTMVNAVSHMATDGTLIYMFGFYSQIKVFDPATRIVTTIAGALPTSLSGTWDSANNYRSVKDSHAGLSAWLGVPWGGLGVDRSNRNLYFFAKNAFGVSFFSGVGGQLRRMSLDGEHPVTTLTGVFPDVTHNTNVVVYGDRLIFGTRNHTLGTSYKQGGYGLASCALDGTDYRLHYIDSDPLGAAKPTGFSSHRAQMTVVGDYLVMNNPVGTKLINERLDQGSIISFPVKTLLAGSRVHSHTAPLFETVVRGGLNVPKYKDGVDGTANYYMGNITSLNDRAYWVGLDYTSSISDPTDYMGASVRTSVRSGGTHNIDIQFSGKAIKGYSVQHALSRSDPREVDLK